MVIKGDLKLHYDGSVEDIVNILLRNQYSVNLTLCDNKEIRLVITSNEESED